MIIDDDPDILEALKVLLEEEFAEIVTENHPQRITSLLTKSSFNVVLLDMNFSAGLNTGNEGLFWLSKILESNPETSVVTMTAYGNIGLAVEAMRRGARDFVLKPWDNAKLLASLKASTQYKRQPKSETSKTNSRMVHGESEVMKSLGQNLQKIAPTDASVLILGENGTGKEVMAQQIHQLSKRKDHPFVHVDLSTINPGIFESELFGHKKGAFTDAKADYSGRFVKAHKGTLFLDEIGNLPVDQQAKLLTVLQKREVVPMGSVDAIPIDVRLITATNANLMELTEKGEFREDLLYRINTISVEIPPLRERQEDIVILANHFLEINSQRYSKPGLSFDESALGALQDYSWPGNVRELQHAIEKGVILSSGPAIKADDLNLYTPFKKSESRQTLAEIETAAIINALKNNNGNIVKAAKELGITRQTLYNKMKRYGI